MSVAKCDFEKMSSDHRSRDQIHFTYCLAVLAASLRTDDALTYVRICVYINVYVYTPLIWEAPRHHRSWLHGL